MTPEELAKFDGPDNAAIADAESMWRRIHPAWIVRDDRQPRGSRISSQVYEESKNPPSPCSIIRARESTAECVQKDSKRSVGAIQAGIVRRHGFRLVSSHDVQEPGHHHMVGPNDRKRQKQTRTALGDATTHVRGPRWGPGIPPPREHATPAPRSAKNR